MNFFARLSIRQKIEGIIYFITILAVGLVFTVVIINNISRFRNQLIDNLDLDARLIGEYCVVPLALGIPAETETSLSTLRSIDYIANGQIYDAGNELFAEYSRDGEPVTRTLSILDTSFVWEKGYLHHAYPMMWRGEFYGTISLSASTTQLQKDIQGFLLMMLGIFLGILVLTSILARRLQRVISNPIIELAQATETITRINDYSLRMDYDNRDEIGTLYDGFNNMLEQIQVRELGREKAEEHLRRFAVIVSSSSDMMALLDKGYTYLAANEAYTEAFGKTSEELIGQTVASVFGEEFFNSVIKPAADNCLAGEEVHYEGWFEFPVTDRRYMDISYYPFINANNEVEGFVVNGRNITDRKNLEQQLLQAQKMESIGRLAGGVAHDFNNLLTAIIGNADLARTKLTKADEAYKHINPILEAADRAANLTRQLLIFSRQEKVEPKVIDLTRVIVDFQKVLQRVLPENIEVKFIHEELTDSIKADMGQMEQVIMNLAVNGRDAMPKGGKLVIETRNIEFSDIHVTENVIVPPGKYVMLSVSDTGAGMDSETISHIFEPFYTTKEKGSGTGLGLSTVYGIIEQSGGYISVYSEVGIGTAFKIYLPAVTEQAEPLSRDSVDTQMPIGTGTILLVEDEEVVREVAEVILSTSGYDVLKAENAAEALNLWEEHKDEIDLLLTDVIMPGISGKELADMLIASRSDLKVLFMSGYSTDVISFHDILPDGVELLQKPFTPHDLATVVKNILEPES